MSTSRSPRRRQRLLLDDTDDASICRQRRRRSWRACSITPPMITRRHQPDGQQLQAARPRLRGTGAHQLGTQQPQRPDPGADPKREQPDGDTHRVPLGRSGLQPLSLAFSLTLAGGHARCPRGVRASRRGRCQSVRDRRRRARQARHPPASAIAQRCVMVTENSTLVQEALGEQHLRVVLRNKRSEWRAYKTQVTRSSGTVISGRCDRDRTRVDGGRRADPTERRSWRARSTWPATRERPYREATATNTHRPAVGAGAIVSHRHRSDGGSAFLRTLRKGGDRAFPVMLLVGGAQLGDLERRDELFDDFCLTPFHPPNSKPACATCWRATST